MQILSTAGFPGYALLDSGDGNRLEKVHEWLFVRPDPQCIWQPNLPASRWRRVDARFIKNNSHKEGWQFFRNIPDSWEMRYQKLTWQAKCTPFKHLGFFPEQHLHWDWMQQRLLSAHGQAKVLNLFGYTGIATIACAVVGARVTHVDASKPTLAWARKNADLSHLRDAPIRWIQDDCLKFVARELKRQQTYDAIIMDPPAYGHAPDGRPWDFMKDFPKLLKHCVSLLSDQPLFLLINAYAISASPLMLENLLRQLTTMQGGAVTVGEICLQEQSSRQYLLSTGMFARWTP
jgi:23S rRNA (cytosine1962-C5)-methyltransferase